MLGSHQREFRAALILRNDLRAPCVPNVGHRTRVQPSYAVAWVVLSERPPRPTVFPLARRLRKWASIILVQPQGRLNASAEPLQDDVAEEGAGSLSGPAKGVL